MRKPYDLLNPKATYCAEKALLVERKRKGQLQNTAAYDMPNTFSWKGWDMEMRNIREDHKNKHY